jgi:hypothetical protein
VVVVPETFYGRNGVTIVHSVVYNEIGRVNYFLVTGISPNVEVLKLIGKHCDNFYPEQSEKLRCCAPTVHDIEEKVRLVSQQWLDAQG